jgi:hypothetical protein
LHVTPFWAMLFMQLATYLIFLKFVFKKCAMLSFAY